MNNPNAMTIRSARRRSTNAVVDFTIREGRVVAIDATGSGDVTKTHELWRAPIGAGYSSPALGGGKLFVVDNSANLYALDPATGEELWELNVGRVGKGSPVWADGKIYLTEVNGRFVIAKDGDEAGEILDIEQIRAHNPQRYEFEQLSHICHVDLEAGEIVGVLDVPEDPWWARGHVPQRPLMPGVLML